MFASDGIPSNARPSAFMLSYSNVVRKRSLLALVATLASLVAGAFGHVAVAADEPTAIIDRQGDVITFRDPAGLTQSLRLLPSGDAPGSHLSIQDTTGEINVAEDSPCTKIGVLVRCPITVTTTLDMQLREGDDTLTYFGFDEQFHPLPALVQGGPGDDEIQTGLGDDELRGQDGDDVLAGEAGDDELIGGPGADQHLGSAGADLVRYDDGRAAGVAVTVGDGVANDGNSVDLGDGAESGKRDLVPAGIEALRATDHADHIVDATTALPLPSPLVVRGLGSNDTLVGDDGPDVLIGDEGNDVILGQAGNDRLHGDAGKDDLEGKEGDDILSGGFDADTLDGGPDADALRGEPGNDVLLARDGRTDNAECGDGDDSVAADEAGVDAIAADCESIAFPIRPSPTGGVQGAPIADSGCAQLRKKLKKARKRDRKQKVRKLRRELRRLGC